MKNLIHVKGCIRLLWIGMEVVKQTVGAPTCPVGYYWMSLLDECLACSDKCFPGSTYVKFCLTICRQTIPPTSSSPMFSQTTTTSPTLASTVSSIADVVHGYFMEFIYVGIAVIIVVVAIIFAVIFRKSLLTLVNRLREYLCRSKAMLHVPTEELNIDSNITHVPQNNVNVRDAGFVQPNGVVVSNGFLKQGVANPQHNGNVQQGLVDTQYENRASSYDPNEMITENRERHLAHQAPTSTTTSEDGASQSLLDSENDTTDNESNNESPIGSTKMIA